MIEDTNKRCSKCKKDFHSDCFIDGKSSKKGRIICADCEKLISKELKLTKINDYFKTEKFKHRTLNKLLNEVKTNPDGDCHSQVSTQNSGSLPTKTESSAKFKLFKGLSAQDQKLVKESLCRALLVKNIKFNDDLVYKQGINSLMNSSALEPGIQSISDYNKGVYNKFKARTKEGNYPPVVVVDDEVQVSAI